MTGGGIDSVSRHSPLGFPAKPGLPRPGGCTEDREKRSNSEWVNMALNGQRTVGLIRDGEE